MSLRSEAIISAGMEGFLAVAVVVSRMVVLANSTNSGPGNNEKELFLKYGGRYVAVQGVSGLASFWLNPITLICVYFFFEAVVRLLAALEGTHIIGSLPMYAISGVHGLLDKAAYKRYVGELVPDKVIRGGDENRGYDLKVYSCRPKLDWNRYVTIEFEGEFYECFNEEPGPPPRRFIYYLRKNPVGRLVVVIKPYLL